MIPAGTAAECRALDASVISGLGLPGCVLMDHAARAVADVIVAHYGEQARRGVVVVCGGGNNGGDGYAIARWLHGWGLPVSLVAHRRDLTGDAAVMASVCVQLGVPMRDTLGPAGVIVDAVFGTGLTREVRGTAAAQITAMNRHPAPVIAVDLPSGVSADTGQVLGVAVRAARTVTFGWHKQGLFSSPGADLAGVVHLADIGVGVGDARASAEVSEAGDLADLWPRRGPADHKRRSGHLGVVAGCESMAGAAVLACRGALAAGAGLVTLFTPRASLVRLGGLPPEVMVVVSGDQRLAPPPEARLGRLSALAAGPGLGDMPDVTASWLRGVWRAEPGPVIFDADALPFVAAGGAGPRVITPHEGEAARRLGCSVDEVSADRQRAARRLAKHGRVAVLKGRYSLVAHGESPVSINPTGCAVLATAGAGDVLTGVVGALLARGVGARDAALLGVWVHGAAADALSRRRAHGWTAGHVVDELPLAVERLVGGGGAPKPNPT